MSDLLACGVYISVFTRERERGETHGIVTGHVLVLSCPNPWNRMVPNVSAVKVRVYASVGSHSVALSGVVTSMFASSCHDFSRPHWHLPLNRHKHSCNEFFFVVVRKKKSLNLGTE